MITRALIPAAGRGRRAYPKTSFMPKVMLEIDGKPLIQRNIELLRDELGIRDITIITGYMAERVEKVLGDGVGLGVTLSYVRCDDVDAGLASGISLARDHFAEPFVTVLGDELYLNSNHRDLLAHWRDDCDVVCAVLPNANEEQIRRNYGVSIEGDRIVLLEEKPTAFSNRFLGCGTYVFTPKIFEAIALTGRSSRTGRVELTDAINVLAQKDTGVRPFLLQGKYFNINSVDEYNYANYVARAQRMRRCRVSVIVPAYNEQDSIEYVVNDFKDHVDEVFVVDNSSRDKTAEVARAAGARVSTVQLKGYGDTIRYGLDHARGDILVVTEADFSFRARDLGKLLEYLKDADMVIGTRTTRQLIEQGTNMRGPVRWGNIIVAKLVEVLWWGRVARFTDVGCTLRALWRDSYQRMRPVLEGVGPELSPEMMVAALITRLRVIEVPVSYHRRVAGDSKHSASYLHIARTASRMLRTIARKRFGWGPAPVESQELLSSAKPARRRKPVKQKVVQSV
jgi:dTDP-glucose pyrophosphorylase